MNTVLVTGFGPFLDVEVNASGLVAREVARVGIPDHEVHVEVLPTAFASREVVKALVERLRPTAVVSIGVARDPFARLERRARGQVMSHHPDVLGESWMDRPLGRDLQAPGIDRWIVDVQAIDATVQVSDDAGGYVCNAIYHAVLEVADVPAAFMHIPRSLAPESITHHAALVRTLVAAMTRPA